MPYKALLHEVSRSLRSTQLLETLKTIANLHEKTLRSLQEETYQDFLAEYKQSSPAHHTRTNGYDQGRTKHRFFPIAADHSQQSDAEILTSLFFKPPMMGNSSFYVWKGIIDTIKTEMKTRRHDILTTTGGKKCNVELTDPELQQRQTILENCHQLLHLSDIALLNRALERLVTEGRQGLHFNLPEERAHCLLADCHAVLSLYPESLAQVRGSEQIMPATEQIQALFKTLENVKLDKADSVKAKFNSLKKRLLTETQSSEHTLAAGVEDLSLDDQCYLLQMMRLLDLFLDVCKAPLGLHQFQSMRRLLDNFGTALVKETTQALLSHFPPIEQLIDLAEAQGIIQRFRQALNEGHQIRAIVEADDCLSHSNPEGHLHRHVSKGILAVLKPLLSTQPKPGKDKQKIMREFYEQLNELQALPEPCPWVDAQKSDGLSKLSSLVRGAGKTA